MTDAYDHEFGDNAIIELSEHLYKSPKSAIKEAVSNGLDQQGKEARIEIFTHVLPDDDIVIEDWGTGIEDFDEFRKALRGYKMVGDRESSYETIDHDLIGNKGLGKWSFMMLSGTTKVQADPNGEIKTIPFPTVEFYSHRPKTERYHAKGMKITMLQKVHGGITAEYMDTVEALPHPGVKVVIKNAKHEILPREATLIQYLAKTFAIRISRGAKIFMNGNQIVKPEGFNSKADYMFSLDDGTEIKGNIKGAEKSESGNLWLFIKNVFVEAESFEHKMTGWINDDFLIPTSSRESISETTRMAELRYKLTEYLDERYEKPNSPKLGKIAKEAEKTQMVVDMMQHQNELLSGDFNEEGIVGEITGGLDNSGKLHRKRGVKLTQTGDETDGPVIPIGDGTRGTGGRYGGKGTKPGYEEGGDHDILTPTANDRNMREGPIKPTMKILETPAGLDKPPAYILDPTKIVMNVSWPQTIKAHKAQGPDWKYIYAPIVAQAVVNFGIKEHEEISNDEWQKRHADYVRRQVE